MAFRQAPCLIVGRGTDESCTVYVRRLAGWAVAVWRTWQRRSKHADRVAETRYEDFAADGATRLFENIAPSANDCLVPFVPEWTARASRRTVAEDGAARVASSRVLVLAHTAVPGNAEPPPMALQANCNGAW